MRFACVCAALVLVVPGLAGAEEEALDDFYLARDREVGSIEVGMTVDDLFMVYDWYSTNLVDLYLEGMFSPALEIYINDEPGGEPSFVAEIACRDEWVVSRIWVYDERFAVSQGVGVGSTLGDLRARCGDVSVHLVEGRVIASAAGIGPVFELDVDRRTVSGWSDEKDPGVFPDSTRVIAMLLR